MTDETVEQVVEDATEILEAVTDELWIPWATRLIPKVASRVRAEAKARAREDHDWQLREEVKHLTDEKLVRAAKRDRRLEEKLMAVLEGWMSQAELEMDSEAEEMGEAEGSEAVGMEDVGMTGGTQSSAMEVDVEGEEGEDEVVVVEIQRGETRKRAPSSLPKSSRKRVQARTATQTPAGSQVKGSSVQGSQVGVGVGTAVSTVNPCWRCVKHKAVCIVPSGRARCENCRVKHYGCSLVPPKEVMGAKGGPLGSQQVKAVVGSQTKGMSRKARKALTLGKSKPVSIHRH